MEDINENENWFYTSSSLHHCDSLNVDIILYVQVYNYE
jgi:hypothetical protein